METRYHLQAMANSVSAFFSNMFSNRFRDMELDLDMTNGEITPDVHSGRPDTAWLKRKAKQKPRVLKPLPLDTPIREDHVRFVCISDTHTKLESDGKLTIPPGDVLLHAGDFTMVGRPDEVEIFNNYLGTLPHKHKVVIAGNHDNSFDLDFLQRNQKFWNVFADDILGMLKERGKNTVHEMLTNCLYLQDSMVQIYGIKIFGSPWTAGFGAWGFQRRRGQQLLSKWNQIPDDTDILITHSPPLGYGDDVGRQHVGCVDLLNTIQYRVKPAYHIYGHIHEGYGVSTDGTTTFINAATCDESYRPINPPIIFDIPLPQGYRKDMDQPLKWISPTSKSGEDKGNKKDDGNTNRRSRDGSRKVDRSNNIKENKGKEKDDNDRRGDGVCSNDDDDNDDFNVGDELGNNIADGRRHNDATPGESDDDNDDFDDDNINVVRKHNNDVNEGSDEDVCFLDDDDDDINDNNSNNRVKNSNQ